MPLLIVVVASPRDDVCDWPPLRVVLEPDEFVIALLVITPLAEAVLEEDCTSIFVVVKPAIVVGVGVKEDSVAIIDAVNVVPAMPELVVVPAGDMYLTA